MKTIKKFSLFLLSICLVASCVKNGIDVSDDTMAQNNKGSTGEGFSYRPVIVISPIDAFPTTLSFRVFKNYTHYGKVLKSRYQEITWEVKNPKMGFNSNVLDEKMASYLEDIFSISGMVLFEPHWFYCCYAGVSGPIKIYADTDIDGYQAGEDLSDLFAVSPAYEQLVGTTYPEMKTLHFFAERDQYVEVPVKEYFAVGTAPLISISYGCVLHTIDGFEYLMEDILDGKLILHFELPITGINSDGEEESRVLTGTIDNA